MPRGDELIIAQRLAKQREKLHTIDNTVYISKKEYTFTRCVFEYGFSMVVPKPFEEMPLEIAKRKFPVEDRPKTIISDEGCRVCIAFNGYEFDGKSAGDRVSAMRSYVKKVRPSNVFFTQGSYELDPGMTIGHFDYCYPVVDGNMYNITFTFDLPDAGILGWFICPLDVKDDWELLARQMVRSIEIVGGGA